MTRPLACIRAAAAGLLLWATLATAAFAADDVSVGTIGTITDSGFYIAAKLGYFKDEGLNVTFTRFDNAGEMIPSLGRGQLDVGSGAVPVGLYNAVERGIGIKIVADKARNATGYPLGAFMVRKALITSGKFKTLHDLKGLRIAIVDRGNSEEWLLSRVLARAGLTFSDVKVVHLPFVEQPAAFANGAIDASVSAEPAVTRIVESGAGVAYEPESDFAPGGIMESAVTIFSDEFRTKRPKVAERFLRALVRAFRFYQGAVEGGHLVGPNADVVISALTEYSNLKDPKLFRKIGAFAVDPNGELDLHALQTVWDFFKDTGQISGKVKVSDVVDMSLVKAAAASLGPYRPSP
ncbi:MAG TPA: ABC transporter substrate-binding protein [Stellaceae bacterium]|nr:ABC transporter substrate-binding protein [Stellaceae bacterium]